MATGGDGDDLGSAVFDAASSGDVGRLRGLLRFKRAAKVRGALLWRDTFDRTPLMAAAAGGHKDMVKTLVEEYGLDVEESKFGAISGEEFTPLVYAANVGHDETVEVLLKNGARVDHAYPLHRACLAAGNLRCVQLLVEHGADLNRIYSDGREDSEVMEGGTPLAVASDQVCCKIVEYLLQRGADPNIGDKKGNTPMHLVFKAIWNSHSERKCRGCCTKDGVKIVEMLIQHGATQARNALELTPAMIGALTGKLSSFTLDIKTLFRISTSEMIELLELLASELLLQGKLELGFKVLCESKELSESLGTSVGNSCAKCPYGDYKEPDTLEDLELLKSDGKYLKIVALIIRERILSAEAQKYYIWQALRDFANQCPLTPDGRKLALMALKHENDLEIESGFFCGFAVESLYRLLDPSAVSLKDSLLEDVVVLFKLAAFSISPDTSQMSHSSRTEAIEYHRMKTINIVYLLSLYANHAELVDADKELLMTLVKEFLNSFQLVTEVMLQLREAELHSGKGLGQEQLSKGWLAAMNARQCISVFHMYYPVLARRQSEDDKIKERMTTMLLKCGADPAHLDMEGYTPLHFLVKNCPGSCQGETFRKGVVLPLVSWGSPILQKNATTGCSVVDDCSNPDTRQLLLDLTLPSLLELAARCVRKNRIPYKNREVPSSIASFLDMNV